jgi:hypothetical protein
MKSTLLSLAILCTLASVWWVGRDAGLVGKGDRDEPEEALVAKPQSAAAIPVQAELPGSMSLPTLPMVRITPGFSKTYYCIPPWRASCPDPNLEAYDTPPVLFADFPHGVTLLSLKAPVTSSCPDPFTGTLDMITDGDKEAADGYYAELDPGKQWVQIDLGASFEIWGVWVWHYFRSEMIYQGVVVQVSDDPTGTNATTIFSNDYANVLGLGVGKDPSYFEHNYGRCIQGHGTKGRYVRLWSCGRYVDELNHYIEVEVYGK